MTTGDEKLDKYYIGIDFGTTNSSLAIFNPFTNKVEPKAVDIGEKPELVRSILSLNRDGEWMLGNQAAALDHLKERSVFSLKTELRNDAAYKLEVDGEVYHLEQLVLIFLQQLLQKAGIAYPEQIERLCLSVPVNMTEDQKGTMERAAMKLGIAKQNIWFIDEPVSVLWDCRLVQGQYVLVFDFGGGTLDMAIMDKYETEDGREVEQDAKAHHYKGKVLAKIGLDIGGDDLDHVIMRMMIAAGKKQGNPVCESISLEVFDDPERLQKLKEHPKYTFYHRLKHEAEKMKRALSGNDSVTIDISPLLPGIDEGITAFKLTLDDFIIQTADIRARMMQGLKTLTDQFEERTGLSRQHIDAVLLSGGSSLVSFVPDLLEELFMNARIVWDEGFLQTRISRGNARYAQSDSELIVGDLVNAAYGIYNHAGDETIVVIDETERYPVHKVKRVATTKPNQQAIEIVPMVRKGEQARFEKFKKDGQPVRWRMTIKPHPETMDLGRISVTYEINKSQRLRVRAYDHLFQTEIGIEEITLADV